MNIGRAVVDRLVANGIDTLFGIPGKQTLPMNEAIASRDDIRFVMARHETAVSHQAWGYAQSTGRPAATVVIPGPGDLNAANGLKNALNDCVPFVHIAIETEPALRGGDAIHETPPDTYDNVVKENILVTSAESTLADLDRAVAIAETPPKGPVRLGIPKNFLREEAVAATAGEYDRTAMTDAPTEAIQRAQERLTDADAPVLLAGGGVRAAEASKLLVHLAETLDAPVLSTYKGKGVIPEDHPLSAGVLCGGAGPEVVECLESADVLCAVGSDLDAVAFRGYSIEVPEELIHITMHTSDIGTAYEPSIGIVADAKACLDALTDELTDRTTGRGEERARAVRSATNERLEPLRDQTDPMTSVSALAAVQEAIPRETIVTADSGGSRLWTLVALEVYGPRRIVTPGSWASMGTALPAAIGAKVANPETPVVSIVGDGGALMAIHELHTAAAEEIPLVVFVINNDDYAIISEGAATNYELDEGAYDWVENPVKFEQVAEGMAMNATTATSPTEITEAISTALDRETPTLVEAKTDPREPQATSYMRE